MTPRRLIAALALLVALPLLWTWWSSERRRIENRVDELQELISKSGKESALESAATAQGVTALFAPSFEIRAEQLRFSTRSREDLARFVLQHRASNDRIEMHVSTDSLEIADEHNRATQQAEFTFNSGGPLGSGNEAYRVQVNWLRGEDGWQIDYIDLLEVIDRGARGF